MTQEASGSGRDSALPHYTNPPLIETVFSLIFKPVDVLTNAHLGVFWSLLRDHFPQVSHQPPITSPDDDFEDERAGRPRALRFSFRQDPDCRLQMRQQDGQRMVQVQPDRLIFNWVQGQGVDPYPRYAALRDEYRVLLKQWEQFVLKEGGQLRPLFWEMVYVNQVEPGTLWSGVSDWSGIFPGLVGPATSMGGQLEDAACNLTYRRWDPDARLYVQLNRVIRDNDPSMEALRLQFTARGPLADTEDAENLWKSASQGLDLGHRMIVLSFRDFASSLANDTWGLQP